MPIYEYKCRKCGHHFEKLRKIHDESVPPCPECLSPEVGRQMSATSFVLKGSGWYKTDYPSDARKQGMASEKKNADGKTDAPAVDSKKDGGVAEKGAAGEKSESKASKDSGEKPAKE